MIKTNAQSKETVQCSSNFQFSMISMVIYAPTDTNSILKLASSYQLFKAKLITISFSQKNKQTGSYHKVVTISTNNW